jgi:hypothetical protein
MLSSGGEVMMSVFQTFFEIGAGIAVPVFLFLIIPTFLLYRKMFK